MPKPTIELPDVPGDWLDTSLSTGPLRHWTQLPRSTEMEAGEPGSGYYTYGTDTTHLPGTAANAQWGLSKAMQVITSVASQLGNGRGYTPLGVGNISLQGGADFRPDHKGHKDGLGIGIRPSRIDGAQKAVTYSQYDREATQRLIDAFHATDQVSRILFNDGRARGVHPWDGHDDHLHVQLKPGG